MPVPTPVQSAKNTNGSASATSLSVTPISQGGTANPTPGNVVVIGISCGSVSGTVTVADNNSNALTVLATNGSTVGYVAYGTIVSGATSYTFTSTNSIHISIVYSEWLSAGAQAGYVGDHGTSNTQDMGTAVGITNGMLVGVVSTNANSVTWSSGTATVYVSENGGTGSANSVMIAYSSSQSGGNFTWGTTSGTSPTWRSAGVGLKPTPGGISLPNQLMTMAVGT